MINYNGEIDIAVKSSVPKETWRLVKIELLVPVCSVTPLVSWNQTIFSKKQKQKTKQNKKQTNKQTNKQTDKTKPKKKKKKSI